MGVNNQWDYNPSIQENMSAMAVMPPKNDEDIRDITDEIISELLEEELEVGKDSHARRYLLKVIEYRSQKVVDVMQNLLLQALLRNDNHRLAYNVLVLLTQLPYEKMGAPADFMAIAATRSKYLDIQELGIRCFEDWENAEACKSLKNCRFSEEWLQEYADEVCAQIMREENQGVLSEKNRAWQVAQNGSPSSSNSA